MRRALLLTLAMLTVGASTWPAVRRLLRRSLSWILRGVLRLRSRPYPVEHDVTTLVFAPHQDDETLGCGGLLLSKRLEGVKVRVAFITDGGGSHPQHPTLTPSALVKKRRAEAENAATLLGLERAGLIFIGQTDGSLGHLNEGASEVLVTKIAAVIAAEKPSEIFLPCRKDGSSEHDAGFALVKRAIERTAVKPRVFEFPVWSWWNPSLLIRPLLHTGKVWRVQFRGYEGLKQQAIASYVTQTQPVAPWTKPVLSSEFTSYFSGHEEFFLEE